MHTAVYFTYTTLMDLWIAAMILLSVLSPVSYTRSMLNNQAKPHRVTRLVIFLVSISALVGILGTSNTAGLIFAGVFFARATYLFIMSLKYGVGGSSKLDKICLAGGIVSLLIYGMTGSGIYAILLGIVTDVIAFMPTFVKTWQKPETEDPLYFFIELLAASCGALAIGEIRTDLLFPVYFILCNACLLLFIYRKKIASALPRTGTTT